LDGSIDEFNSRTSPFCRRRQCREFVDPPSNMERLGEQRSVLTVRRQLI
jgi:hypothetical protein